MALRLRNKIEEADIRLREIVAYNKGEPRVYNLEQLQNMQLAFNQQITYLLKEIREQEIDYETYINNLLQDLETYIFEKKQAMRAFKNEKIAILTEKIYDLHQEIRGVSDLPDIIKDFRKYAFKAIDMVYGSKEGHVYSLQAHLLELNNEMDEILYQTRYK